MPKAADYKLDKLMGADFSAVADSLANISDLINHTEFIFSTAISAPVDDSVADNVQMINSTAISSPAAASLADILQECSVTAISSPVANSMFDKISQVMSGIGVLSGSVQTIDDILSGVSASLTYLVSSTVGDTPVTGSVGRMIRDGLMQSGGAGLPVGKSLYEILYGSRFFNASATVSALTSTTMTTTLVELSFVSTSFRKKIHNVFIDMTDFIAKALTANITLDVQLQSKIDGTNWRKFDNKIFVKSDNPGLVIGPMVAAEDVRVYLSASTAALSAGTGITAFSIPTRYVYEYLE